MDTRVLYIYYNDDALFQSLDVGDKNMYIFIRNSESVEHDFEMSWIKSLTNV